jgi:hypothetical protein
MTVLRSSKALAGSLLAGALLSFLASAAASAPGPVAAGQSSHIAATASTGGPGGAWPPPVGSGNTAWE